MAYRSDVAIQSVQFRPDGICEVTYAEQREMGDKASMVKLLMFDRDIADGYVSELEDAARELVDVVLTFMAGDPMQLAGRQR